MTPIREDQAVSLLQDARDAFESGELLLAKGALFRDHRGRECSAREAKRACPIGALMLLAHGRSSMDAGAFLHLACRRRHGVTTGLFTDRSSTRVEHVVAVFDDAIALARLAAAARRELTRELVA